MKYAWLPVFVVLGPAVALADPSLPTGGVACLSLKDAKAYVQYMQDAPGFAEDLLARAACYEVKDTVAAVKKGVPEQGFQAYRLISGHNVWLPVAR